jgi:aminoglycoside phosphotransferase (APT) family kinase protein
MRKEREEKQQDVKQTVGDGVKQLEAILKNLFPHSNVNLLSWERCDPNATCDVRTLRYTIDDKPYDDKRVEEIIFKAAPDEKPRLHKRIDIPREVAIMSVLENRNKLRIPRLLLADFSYRIWPTDYFIMEKARGKRMSKLIHDATTREELEGYAVQTAEMLASLHSLDLELFSFLPRMEYADFVYGRLQEVCPKVVAHLEAIGKPEGVKLVRRTMRELERRYPRRKDVALINSDVGANHIYVDEKELWLIDWDEAFIGDRSWEVYWVTRGMPRETYRLDDADEIIIGAYEESTGRELQNKSFYRLAVIATAYILSIYEDAYGNNPLFKDVVKKLYPLMEESLRKRLRK